MPPWDWDHYTWYDIDWGDVPTALALLAALIAGYVGYRIYKVESERDQNAALERRSAQAARVSLWIEYVDVEGEVLSEEPHHSEPFWQVTIRNGSDLPVYEAFATVKATPQLAAQPEYTLLGMGFGVLPPGDALVKLLRRDVVGVQLSAGVLPDRAAAAALDDRRRLWCWDRFWQRRLHGVLQGKLGKQRRWVRMSRRERRALSATAASGYEPVPPQRVPPENSTLLDESGPDL